MAAFGIREKTEKVAYLIFDKAGHGFSTAEEEQLWYDSLMGFLDEHNPADDRRVPESGSTEK